MCASMPPLCLQECAVVRENPKPEELNEWSLKWFQSQVAAQEPPPVEADEEMHAAAAKVQAVNRGRAARKAK